MVNYNKTKNINKQLLVDNYLSVNYPLVKSEPSWSNSLYKCPHRHPEVD